MVFIEFSMLSIHYTYASYMYSIRVLCVCVCGCVRMLSRCNYISVYVLYVCI